MPKTAHILVPIAIAMCLVGCSDDSGEVSPDAGTTDSGTTDAAVGEPDASNGAPTEPGVHPMCHPPFDEVGAAMGMPCGATSPELVCVVEEEGYHCESQACLWHDDDPAGESGYCTEHCDVDDPDSCPDGFACQIDDCEGVEICVRTEQPPDDTRFTSYPNAVHDGNDVVYTIGISDDGLAYFATGRTSGGVLPVYEVDLDGSTQSIGEMEVHHRSDQMKVDETFYFLTLSGTDDTLGAVDSGELTVEELGSNHHVGGGFIAEDGTPYYLLHDYVEFRSGFVELNPDLDDLFGENGSYIAADEGELQPVRVVPLRSHGFVGTCNTPDGGQTACVSADGTDIVDLSEFEHFTPEDFRHSFRPDDLWGTVVVDDTTTVVRWDGEQWLYESELATQFHRINAVVPLNDGESRAIAIAYDALASPSVVDAIYLDGSCWKALHHDHPPGESIPYDRIDSRHSLTRFDDGIMWAVDGDLHRVTTSDFEFDD